MSKKATKLKDMKLTSVDLVKRGANPDADICLFKSAEEDPSEILLPQTEKGRIRQIIDTLKSLLSADDESESDPESVMKEAKSFSDLNAKRESREKLWKYSDAFQESIGSILNDDDLDSAEKKQMMNASLEQYSTAMKALIDNLVPNDTTITVVSTKSADDGDPAPTGEPDPEENPINKGESDMAYDMSKLTDDERATFEKLSKKCKVADTKKSAETDPAPATKPAADPAPAETTPAPTTEPTVTKTAEVDPVLKSALDEVKALKKNFEMRELTDIAKKYEPLGKKTDELAQQLYELKKSGDANYNAYISLLDEQLDLVNKSGIFTELGKNVHGPVTKGADDAYSKAEAIAKSYIEKDPSLDYNSAMVKAWDNNPELRAEYENNM